MTRTEIITELKEYFSVEDLVCQHAFKRFSEKAWQFLDTEYLHTVLVVRRDIVQEPMICNYSVYRQRGLRCNLCQLVRDKTNAGTIYLSAHVNGAGGDFTSPNITAEAMRQLIKKNKHLLPYNIRIEKSVTWLHIDCYDTGEKVNEFNG